MSDRTGYWPELIERQACCQLTVREFCEFEGVSTASFYSWRRRIVDAEYGNGAPAFVPINVARPKAIACVEIVLSDSATIRVPDGTDRQTIVDVLAAMEASV